MAFDATDFQPATVDPKSLTTGRERLEYMERFLRDLPPERFDMSASSLPECGTPACIAGWAIQQFDREYEDFRTTGTEVFGLTREQGGALFFGFIYRATPTQAANVIAHLLATSDPGETNGVVDWSKAGEP